ncbi:MAG: DUF378 domain-containing protein [Candidatus Pacebacteria bacterium]|nr:DUF378 domain-containing protein [Candidatus Paceibacterota bacterium]
MKGLHKISFILLIIGGLNWLIIGLIGTDYVMQILGGSIARIVYILVGLSAIAEIVNHKSLCKSCDKGMSQM